MSADPISQLPFPETFVVLTKIYEHFREKNLGFRCTQKHMSLTSWFTACAFFLVFALPHLEVPAVFP